MFDRARTFAVDVRGVRVAIAGFPSERDDVRARFIDLVRATRWHAVPATVRLLCLHQCVEGATVGPNDFTFTTAADVIRGRDVPAGFAAVLCGHIHRHQVLTRDLRGVPLAAPVLYPGSIERTSVAEADEEKGFMIVEVAGDDSEPRVDWQFHRLPARPLVRHELHLEAIADDALEAVIHTMIASVPEDAVLTVRIVGLPSEQAWRVLSAANLRRLSPPSMNIALRLDGDASLVRTGPRPRHSDEVLELPL